MLAVKPRNDGFATHETLETKMKAQGSVGESRPEQSSHQLSRHNRPEQSSRYNCPGAVVYTQSYRYSVPGQLSRTMSV